MRLRSNAIRRVLEQDVKLLAELPDALKKKPFARSVQRTAWTDNPSYINKVPVVA